MNNRLTTKIIIFSAMFFVSFLKPYNKFYPTTQITPSPFYSEKLIEYKIRELQLLLDYAPYLQQMNMAGYFNKNPFLEQFNLLNPFPTKTEKVETKKFTGKKIGGKLCSGLNAISMPFRRGIGKGFENLTSKIAYKGIIMGLGCLGYWAFWGRRNNPDLPFHKNFFLPIITAFKIVKKFLHEEKSRVDISEVEIDNSVSGHINFAWNKVAGWFSKNKSVGENLSTDANLSDNAGQTNIVTNITDKFKVGFESRAVAIAFLVFANFLF